MDKFWTWNGRKLRNPVGILRMFIATPILWILKLLIVVVAFIGWGREDAISAWEDLKNF